MTSNLPRSSLGCIVKCQHVGRCGSVAFDPASGICYLQPTYRAFRQGDAGPPVSVYIVETASKCKPSETPSVANAHVTQWYLTSSALVGDVSCDRDYILSANVTSQVRCQLESGVWSTVMAATCNQSAWRNYTVEAACLLPRPAQVGLSVRLKGTPTDDTRFTFDLLGSPGDIVLHIDARFRWDGASQATCLDHKQGNVWKHSVILRHPSPPFPFAVGVPFQMVITAVDMFKFSIQVNGVHYTTYEGTLPVTALIQIVARGQVSVEYLIFSY